MEARDSTGPNPIDDRLQMIRHRTIGRSEVIRLRLQRVHALQAELWKRMDRLERERRRHEGWLEGRASDGSLRVVGLTRPQPELTGAS
ncbi:MAG: hypothetical protein KY464_15645 [Gemmatimonadetes bacterium]|nr:hypothetical protein [Gemmatimonadota bacterium]